MINDEIKNEIKDTMTDINATVDVIYMYVCISIDQN